MNDEQIGLAPLVGWQLAPVAGLHAVMLRLDFLTHATQGLEEPQQTPRFVLTAAVALELSEALKKHAQLALQGSLGAGQDRH